MNIRRCSALRCSEWGRNILLCRPVKFADHFTRVDPACPACPVEPGSLREIYSCNSGAHFTGVPFGCSTGVAPADGTGVKNKPLAEKMVEDVLGHFGDTIKVARRRYRQFVKQGADQGARPELQGGGLVRSAGGNKAGLLGRSKEERDPHASTERAQARDGGLGKADARILGSGDFVSNVLIIT
ncbi:MAG: hypothetical protein JRJ57_10300 [Deltaproteobacteria bacterium]|nr:hypothetical protein [Deltaproteobacteria bacterium]